MSTKVPQPCPECGAITVPEEAGIRLDLTLAVSMLFVVWRYRCPACGWLWTDEAQRKHNDREYVRTHRRAGLSG